jgi:hypothetical protein
MFGDGLPEVVVGDPDTVEVTVFSSVGGTYAPVLTVDLGSILSVVL